MEFYKTPDRVSAETTHCTKEFKFVLLLLLLLLLLSTITLQYTDIACCRGFNYYCTFWYATETKRILIPKMLYTQTHMLRLGLIDTRPLA